MNRFATFLFLLTLALSARAEEKPAAQSKPIDLPANGLVMVVMDPLAAPLSCPCVEGYAQRDYDQLAAYLSSELGKPVVAVYNASLVAALDLDTKGRADIVIGKSSVVKFDAQRAKALLKPVLSLSGKDGQTTQHGLFLVLAGAKAKSVADLKDHRVFFGTEDSDEKYAAAMQVLKQHNIGWAAQPDTCAACSDGATKLLELGPSVPAATVISSYAAPLLEGCGTVKKGDLRIVGKTADIPFVEAFVSTKLPASEQANVEQALLKVSTQVNLLKALETLFGFVSIEPQKKS